MLLRCRVDDGATPTSVEAFHDFLAVAKADGYAQLACGIGITIYGVVRTITRPMQRVRDSFCRT